MTTFRDSVLAVVKKIPVGSVMTYGEVARRAGSARAARAVGNIMKNNSDHSVPCHRVVKGDGTVGGYNGLKGEKEALLAAERKGR